jgi:hypothetical protein
MLPGPAGLTGRTGAEPDVAKIAECVRRVIAVGALLVKLNGPPIAADRLLVVAELAVNVAEAVRRRRSAKS